MKEYDEKIQQLETEVSTTKDLSLLVASL